MAKYRCAILDDYPERRAQGGGLVEGHGRRRHQGVQRAPRRGRQRGQGAAGLRDRLRHARAHRLPARRDREAAGPQAPDHHRHAQRLDRHGGGRRQGRHRLRHRLVRQPDLRHRHRPDARADPPHRLRERAAEGRRDLADHHRPGARRPDARHPRPRQARHPHRADRQGVRHEGDRLEPEPDAREVQGSRRRLRDARRSCSGSPTSSRSTWCCRSARAGWSAPRNSR